MSEMKRWNVPDGSDYECPDGDFVLYADHQVAIAALEQRLTRAVELLTDTICPEKRCDICGAAKAFLAEEASRG